MLSRKREDVQSRHLEIHWLRRQPRYTLKEIAEAVGLKDHTTVLYHLNGNCKCGGKSGSACNHAWKCTKCGAHG